jgi:hypothetical protein
LRRKDLSHTLTEETVKMAKWDLYVRSPRWLDVSGLPQKLSREVGPGAWVVLKKICEIDCDANLVPDWFSVASRDLSAWTGLRRSELRAALRALEKRDLLDVQELPSGWRLRVRTPIPVPATEEKIRERVRALGLNSKYARLRYRETDSADERFSRVLELYQSVFGTRISSHIVDELREVAENFEWPAIEEAFSEAREQKKTNFHSVVNQLYKEIYDEQVAENLRDAAGPPLPSGYELT